MQFNASFILINLNYKIENSKYFEFTVVMYNVSIASENHEANTRFV
jgi:hypothetical protein